MLCYCKQEIQPGDRTLQIDFTVDWGDDDLRHQPDPKHYVFHSFKCVADWANDRALTHDGVVVREGAPS